MRILNFGSLNLDYVYAVDHIVLPGETISSRRLDVFCGGKGLNQSVALARAGAPVSHAGMIGPDGEPLLALCRENGIDATHIREVRERSGNAIIQVAADGQNSIVLFGGANRLNEESFVDSVLGRFSPGDMLLLQNEINLLPYIVDKAAERGMFTALNPSPFDAGVTACDLGKIALFMVNEVEGAQITGATDPEAILDSMAVRFPRAKTVLTLGGDGAVYQDGAERIRHPAFPAKVVDTTAAGDTFAGYFLAAFREGKKPAEALRLASFA
ncbi:MAG: ribokinase, partial [Planctomycetota bacterium]|nr:ribokinase [Planctomycetota bacterium]